MKSDNEPENLVGNFIAKSYELAKWLNRYSSKRMMRNDMRSQLATSFLDIALEHYKSIAVLTSKRCYTSAGSLLRIMVQAYVKGLWIAFHATQDDLDYLVEKDRLKKTFGAMVAELEARRDNDRKLLTIIKERGYSGMSNYVHTGMVPVSRHYTDKPIEPHYTEQEIVQMLDFVNLFSIIAVNWMNQAIGSTRHPYTFTQKTFKYVAYSKSILKSFNLGS